MSVLLLVWGKNRASDDGVQWNGINSSDRERFIDWSIHESGTMQWDQWIYESPCTTSIEWLSPASKTKSTSCPTMNALFFMSAFTQYLVNLSILDFHPRFSNRPPVNSLYLIIVRTPWRSLRGSFEISIIHTFIVSRNWISLMRRIDFSINNQQQIIQIIVRFLRS